MAFLIGCENCKSSGLQNGLYGPVPCTACNGNGEVFARNEKGQFIPLALLSRNLKSNGAGVSNTNRPSGYAL